MKLVDFAEPANNDGVVINQFRVREGDPARKPDVVAFVNGLPLGVIELKKQGDDLHRQPVAVEPLVFDARARRTC